MDSLTALIAVSVAILLGAMSPGPSFLIVARTAIASSSARGVWAALGMGIGGAAFALAASLGLQLLLATVPAIYKALQLAGAAYLLFIAYRLWKSAPDALETAGHEVVRQDSWRQALLLGLGTQLSNPKAAIVYASVFSAVLPKVPSLSMVAVLALTVFAIEFAWYVLVAIAFSTGKARQAYTRGKIWIDRLAAGAIAALGVKILADAELR
ncbi:MAG: LysE family translocator [Bradyrhizobium sp.]|nr:LysE family translocator [Bradyrhizobium sp.]